MFIYAFLPQAISGLNPDPNTHYSFECQCFLQYFSTPGKPDLATSLTISTSTSKGGGGGQAEQDLLEAGKAKPRLTGALALFLRNRTPPPR